MPKNFNTSGSKFNTTPGYASTKAARDAVAQAKAIKAHDAAISRLSTDPKTANLPKKEFDKLLDKTSKSFTKPSKTRNFKKDFDKFQAQKQKANKWVKNLKAKNIVKAGGKRLLGVLGLMGAGTLSATATPTDKQGKKGSYTDDFTKLK